MNNYPLVYLDNGATTQKPQSGDRCARALLYARQCQHPSRYLFAQPTRDRAFELARQKVAQFIGAPDAACCIFVRGTTEAINMVAQSLGAHESATRRRILLTELEHHSNIVPWQMACQASGATLRRIPMTDDGDFGPERLGGAAEFEYQDGCDPACFKCTWDDT